MHAFPIVFHFRTMLSFILILWIHRGLQNPYECGNINTVHKSTKNIWLRSQEVK